MEISSPGIAEYAESFSSPESDVLAKLNRETNARVPMARMLSGHLQGQFLSMISNMIQPELVLEIGTYTGYSAICLAKGLRAGGMLYTIDINDELVPMVKRYFSDAGLTEKISFHTGNAINIIPGLGGPFDLVFIDADKINYSAYYDLVFDKVKKGGYILADNVLWSGKVLEDDSKMDADTLAITAFNQKIHQDTRVENVLLPVRDGLMLIRKI